MAVLTKAEIERYSRQLVLKEIGGAGQQALNRAKVLIIGAGGLGGPVGLYLAAAGVGTIGLVDHDNVEASNLHRQIQFTQDDIGRAKVEAMAAHLHALNPHIVVKPYKQFLDADTVNEVMAEYDLVLDGTDEYTTRFVINAASLATQTPLISGAVGRFDGQVALFSADGVGPCYRCLVPEIPPDAQTCEQVGIVGALAGIVGSVMTLEAIKWITGAGDTLASRLWIYDGLSTESRTLNLPRDPACPVCSKAQE